MKYVKKPIVVEAFQWFTETIHPGVYVEVRALPPIDLGDGVIEWPTEATAYYVITAHGQRAYLEPGDWVITEPDGVHHYPCKPEIFEASYRPYVGGLSDTVACPGPGSRCNYHYDNHRHVRDVDVHELVIAKDEQGKVRVKARVVDNLMAGCPGPPYLVSLDRLKSRAGHYCPVVVSIPASSNHEEARAGEAGGSIGDRPCGPPAKAGAFLEGQGHDGRVVTGDFGTS